jgi:hypothetical protein
MIGTATATHRTEYDIIAHRQHIETELSSEVYSTLGAATPIHISN